MTIRVEELAAKPGWEERVKELKELAMLMLDYLYNENGAIREWPAMEFEDNHEHRHISHLYPARPAFARCNTEVKELRWDIDAKKVPVTLMPSEDRMIHIRCDLTASVDEKVQLRKGEVKDLVLYL